jgi:hypothetical protein
MPTLLIYHTTFRNWHHHFFSVCLVVLAIMFWDQGKSVWMYACLLSANFVAIYMTFDLFWLSSLFVWLVRDG